MGDSSSINSSTKVRNAEDEACARELLVLGGGKTASGKSKKISRSRRRSNSPITIVLPEMINGHADDLDTFTFIDSNNDAAATDVSLVEPTLNSAILTDVKPGHQRVIMHVGASSSNNDLAAQPQTFAHALDGNLTDPEEESEGEEGSSLEVGTAASSSSHSSEAASNAISSQVIDLSTKLDDNQPIDYSKKTLSNSSSSSSLVSPPSSSSTSTAASRSARKPSGFILSVESLLSRSPPRSLSTTPSASITPYHPTTEEDKRPEAANCDQNILTSSSSSIQCSNVLVQKDSKAVNIQAPLLSSTEQDLQKASLPSQAVINQSSAPPQLKGSVENPQNKEEAILSSLDSNQRPSLHNTQTEIASKVPLHSEAEDTAKSQPADIPNEPQKIQPESSDKQSIPLQAGIQPESASEATKVEDFEKPVLSETLQTEPAKDEKSPLSSNKPSEVEPTQSVTEAEQVPVVESSEKLSEVVKETAPEAPVEIPTEIPVEIPSETTPVEKPKLEDSIASTNVEPLIKDVSVDTSMGAVIEATKATDETPEKTPVLVEATIETPKEALVSSEAPIEPPKEAPVSVEASIEAPKGALVPLETPIEAPKAAPVLVEAPMETPVEAKVKDLTEPPIEISTEAKIEVSSEASVKTSPEAPVETPAITSTETAVDVPTEAPIEPVTEARAEVQSNAPSDAHTKDRVEVPIEPSSDAPTESPVETPVETPIEAPSATPVKVPVEPPTKAPLEAPIKIPVEPPIDAPTEVPVEPPIDAPTEVQVEPPIEATTEAPIEVEHPIEAPTEDTAQVPAEVPIEAPLETFTKSSSKVTIEKSLEAAVENAEEISSVETPLTEKQDEVALAETSDKVCTEPVKNPSSEIPSEVLTKELPADTPTESLNDTSVLVEKETLTGDHNSDQISTTDETVKVQTKTVETNVDGPSQVLSSDDSSKLEPMISVPRNQEEPKVSVNAIDSSLSTQKEENRIEPETEFELEYLDKSAIQQVPSLVQTKADEPVEFSKEPESMVTSVPQSIDAHFGKVSAHELLEMPPAEKDVVEKLDPLEQILENVALGPKKPQQKVDDEPKLDLTEKTESSTQFSLPSTETPATSIEDTAKYLLEEKSENKIEPISEEKFYEGSVQSVAIAAKSQPQIATENSCDTEETPVTVIPLPSTLSLVNEDQEVSASSIGLNLDEMDNFEDEIVPKEIRPRRDNSISTEVTSSVANHDTTLEPMEPEVPQPILSAAGSAPIAIVTSQIPAAASTVGNFVCNVCNKDCPSENELALHKKRHKLESPLVCEYCNQTYTNRHRYEVHVRYHTGETPFKCHLCGKGFRDDRKMRLHVARHNSSLSNKCHLCPRSFEGPKALQKHIIAHQMGRYVQPKVIMNPDGSTAMALPTETGAGGPGVGTSTIVSVQDNTAGLTTPSVITGTEGQMMALAGLQPIPPAQNNSDSAGGTAVAVASTAAATDEDQATISLSMDDLMQYAQPVPDGVIHEENGLEDKLTAGATTKFVPLNMDEFIKSEAAPGVTKTSPQESNQNAHDDSGEFPDLLDSESNLESLSFAATRPKTDSLHEDQESGLTFATLSGVKPVFPENIVQAKDGTVVCARKSAPVVKSAQQQQQPQIAQQATQQSTEEPTTGTSTVTVSNAEVSAALAQVKTDDLVNVLASEAMNQLAKQIKLPAGTCLVPADAKCEPNVFAAAAANQGGQFEVIGTTLQSNSAGGQTNPMTITIQYKIYPDSQSEPQKVAVQRDLADIINEAPPETIDPNAVAAVASVSSGAAGGTTTPLPTSTTPTPPVSKSTAKVKPMGADMDPQDLPAIPVQQTGPDPSKDTRKVISPMGKEFDVPTIVTSGYDLDKLMCTFCNKTFKNDKTLMSHMLHHFGVTPKMASCPICGLTLQKKSYARHLRLHGNVVPEVCPYCSKEFREKRSLDKHIKAIHHAERPFACPIPDCNETFRNQVELKNHHNRHIKDYPYECDRCPMTFQKQDSLTTHYRSHTGEKPFVCEICDRSFTSEKNKKVHVQRHQGSLPHKCEVCGMTFQSRSHLIKHATSHSRKAQQQPTQPTVAVSANKINNFLESFSASLGDDMLGGMGGIEEAFEDKDNSVRLSVDTIPESLEAAAAEAALAFNQEGLTEDLLRQTEIINVGNVISVPTTSANAALGLASSTDQNVLQCDICMTKLKDKRAYIVHMKKHAGTLSLKCKFCGLILQGQQTFNKHIRTNHNMDPNTVQAIVVEEEEPEPDAESSLSSESFRQTSGRGSVASNLGGDSWVKCALCPEVFSSHELLQKHTTSHFDANKTQDDILREKLLQQTMRKKKKKKNKNKNEAALAAAIVAGGGKVKYKKSYSCLLCDSTFIKKASWRIHKIRHNGKGWKCQFCTELHETSEHLKEHLSTVHKMDSEEMEMLGILKQANMFVVSKKLKPVKEKSKANSDSSSGGESESDSEDASDDEDDEIDYEEDDDEEDETTTNASTPTPFSVSSLPLPVTTQSQVTTINTELFKLQQQTPAQHAPSPTPSSSSGSGLPVLKFIEDETLFDLDALTCHACNKSFKNTRAFKLHRDRHQGALKHKCPECIKTFNGRSEVNRHMVAIHGRPLAPDEDTLHKKADKQQQMINSTLNINTTIMQEDPNKAKMLTTPPIPKLTSPTINLMETPTISLPVVTTAAPIFSTLTSTLDLNTTSTISTIASGLMLTSTPAQPEKISTTMTSTPMLHMPSLMDPEPQTPQPDPSVIAKPVEMPLIEQIMKEPEPVEAAPEIPSLPQVPEPQKIAEPAPPSPVISNHEDDDFEALIAAKPVNFNFAKEPSAVEEVVKFDAGKSVKVTSPKAQDMIEDNFDDKAPDLDDSISKDDKERSEEEEDEAEEDEEEEVLPRRRCRSQTSSAQTGSSLKKSASPKKMEDSNSPAKRKRGRPKRVPEPSTSEDSSQEKEKENSAGGGKEPKVSGQGKLIKQKGVTVNKEGKVMIPSHKITLPEELCQIVENKKGKKMYQCQICSKEFNRKDIINYHVYNEHREEFLEYGKGLPEALTRDESTPTKSSSNNAAAAIFKRIFKPKMMSGNKDSVRKGQVEIEVKSSKHDDDDDDRSRILKTMEVAETSPPKMVRKVESPPRAPSPIVQEEEPIREETPPPPPSPLKDETEEENKNVEEEVEKEPDKEEIPQVKEDLPKKEEPVVEAVVEEIVKKAPGRRGRKPKVPKHIPQEQVIKEAAVEITPVQETEEDEEAIGSRTRRSRRKSGNQTDASPIPAVVKSPEARDVSSPPRSLRSPAQSPEVRERVASPVVAMQTSPAPPAIKTPEVPEETTKEANIPPEKPRRGRKPKNFQKPVIEDNKSTETPIATPVKEILKPATFVPEKFEPPAVSEEPQQQEVAAVDDDNAEPVKKGRPRGRPRKEPVKVEEEVQEVVKLADEQPAVTPAVEEDSKPLKGRKGRVGRKPMPKVDHPEIPAAEEVPPTIEKTEEESPVEKVDEAQEEEEENFFRNVKGRKGRIGRKATRMLHDVDQLIEYQEQQRRLRNRTLLDSPEAVKLLKKYRKKRRKVYSAANVTDVKLTIKRQHSKPYHTIQMTSNLKFKLIRQTPESDKVAVAEIPEDVHEERPPPTKPSPVEMSSPVPDETPLKPKKRGRPPKKAIEEDIKVENLDTEEIITPPAKRRQPSSSPVPLPEKEMTMPAATTEMPEPPRPESPKLQPKRRGRPPKKAFIAEMEAAAAAEAAAEAAKLSQAKTAEETKPETKPPTPPTPVLKEKVEPIVEEKPAAVVPVNPKKRGRPPKKAVEAVEEVEEQDDEIVPLKRRALRERKPMTMADNDDDIFEVEDRAEPVVAKAVVQPVSPPKINETPAVVVPEKSEEQPLKSPKKEPPTEINDNRYVVQHVDANPLKIKLKTGLNNSDSDVPKAPLKLKISMRDEMSKKPKKHKKKKDKDRDDKKQIILRIKSPSSLRESTTEDNISNNGYLDDKNNSDNNKSLSSSSRVRVPSATSDQGQMVTFSPESSPEHNPQPSFAFLNKDNEIGLGEGQFNDLMKAIGDSDDESKPARNPIFAGETSSSVKQSQVDGTIDSWSRSSSISQSSPIHLSADETFAEDEPEDKVIAQSSVIHQRMKQIQGRPKTKSCLIKHVFSAVARKRKIVVVKYRKPIQRIFDKDEHQERARANTLDESYDEDTDDPTLKKKAKSSIVLLSEPVIEEDECWRDDPAQVESLQTLTCVECGRSLPNVVRMHAHLQMHRESKKKREDRIVQLDGENDLFLEDETPVSTAIPATSTAVASTSTASTTHLYILKSQDAKVYQCSQCPEVFPGQKALLTHQSLVHHDSLTIYPCQQCNIGFKDSNSLEQHMRSEHGKQQIVTIIQADLPRDTGSTGSSFGSGSSSCSSSTTSSHPSSSSSGYFTAQSDALGTNGNGEGATSHPLLMKQDPVLMFNSDEEQDLMLDESLNLFETSSLIDSGDSAIHLSLDDLANFAQPIVAADGSHNSFDTSIETSSFLSGTDALDIINDANHHTPLSSIEGSRNTATSGSRTPSISDDGEFPCTQCEKRFGNRRNLLSHMRRHTGDFKLFCDHCNKGFFTQSKLESHKRKHTGEKPFRCLLKTCLKRFRYKGDLSKHIKKYHPGHTQELTPIPLQEDELINLQNQAASTSFKAVSSNNAVVISSTSTSTTTSGADNKFLPLLPRHPVQHEELVASGFSKDLGSDNNDPSLDDNILDLLTEDDSPMASISPGPSLPPPPPPPPPMPPPKAVAGSGTTIVSSKLHEVLTQGRPKAPSEAFVVPTSASIKTSKPHTTTHIVNLANPSSFKGTNKPLAISISQVFACAQPVPLQEDAKHQSKGKMTTMADLDARSASSVLSANAAFVQGLVNARKTGTTIIATSGSGGNIFRTASGQQVSIIKGVSSASNSGVTAIVTSAAPRPTKAFVCDFKGCNKSFEKATFLKRHAKLHSSNCKFVCDVCTKCFESQSKLDDHYRKHTGAKPFICHICGNAFRYKGDRTKHLKNIHGVLKTTVTTAAAASATSVSGSDNGSNGLNPFIVEDTSSSISSFQSTSDQSSVAGSLVESPTKTEPMESFSMRESTLMSTDDTATETITMTLEDISQFAQDIY